MKNKYIKADYKKKFLLLCNECNYQIRKPEMAAKHNKIIEIKEL